MSAKISQLTPLLAGSVDTTADLLPIVDTSATTTKKITPSAFLLENTFSETWNNAGTTFKGLDIDITDTASNAASTYLNIKRSGTSLMKLYDVSDLPILEFGGTAQIRGGVSGALLLGASGGYVYLGDFISIYGGEMLVHGANNFVKMRSAVKLCWSQNNTSYGTTGPQISVGSGSPDSVVSAQIGSLYLRTDGGASTTLYVKESGAGTNTGWVAK